MAAAFDRALREALAEAGAGLARGELARAVEALSERYRAGATEGRPIGRLSDAERVAYAIVRLPATAAALDAVFDAYSVHGGPPPATITDLGAGPATVLWPALARWPELERITLIDRDPAALQLGLRLGAGLGGRPQVDCRACDLGGADVPAADLVVASYALGELAAEDAARAVDRALGLARLAAVFVEPGTPPGFARILAARTAVLRAGGVLVAPCPSAGDCPMAHGDWCHFAVRLDRTREHRQLKHGTLGWEDEKFAYLIAAPPGSTWPTPAPARVVRRPFKGTGHVKLSLCSGGALAPRTVTRRDADYRAARDAAWGDAWPPPRRG
jgi:ribosomal protein RSM22 (predicted rRNA methylase)